jgi:shikimate kinase
MRVKIEIIGPRACGKTFIANELKAVLQRAQEEMPARTLDFEITERFQTQPSLWSKEAPFEELKRFHDGKLKPFLSPKDYDDLRDDDKFLYNRRPE